MKRNHFDPHTSFIDLPIFRKTLIISAALAITTGAIIAASSNLKPSFTFEGFNQALTVFKFPLGILAITIPIIALLAANHRSEQTKEQMRLASENNNFSNYFKHYSEFQSYLEKSRKPTGLIAIRNTRNLHIKLFPGSKDGVYQASEEQIKKIDHILIQYIETIEILSQFRESYSAIKNIEPKIIEDNELKEAKIEKIKNGTTELMKTLTDSLNNYFSSLSLSQDDNEEPKILPLKEASLDSVRFLGIKHSLLTISQALGFDEKYEPSEGLKALFLFSGNGKGEAHNSIEQAFFKYYHEKTQH